MARSKDGRVEVERYTVYPGMTGVNIVGRQGNLSGKIARNREQIDAIRKAGGGEVIIHGRDGRIRHADTTVRGRDPQPPTDTPH